MCRGCAQFAFGDSRCLLVWCTWGPRHRHSERKKECGSAVHHAFRPDLSAVPPDDSLNRGQADAASGELLRTVEPLKCSEKLIHICHVKACSIVSYVVHVFTAVPVNVRGVFR